MYYSERASHLTSSPLKESPARAMLVLALAAGCLLSFATGQYLGHRPLPRRSILAPLSAPAAVQGTSGSGGASLGVHASVVTRATVGTQRPAGNSTRLRATTTAHTPPASAGRGHHQKGGLTVVVGGLG